jgi:hypothetical protein
MNLGLYLESKKDYEKLAIYILFFVNCRRRRKGTRCTFALWEKA